MMKKAGMRKFFYTHIPVHFYSRLTICYTVILALVAFVFAILASRYYENLQTVKKLKDSMYTLNAISSYYELKNTSFPDAILPVVQMDEGNQNLESLLQSSADGVYDDPMEREKITEIFGKIAERDSDIESILLFANCNHTMYVYSSKYNTLETVGDNYPFYSIVARQTDGRIDTGTRELLTYDSQNKVDVGYGIGGTIRSYTDSESLGQFLVIYNTKKIESIFRNYHGNYGRFLILTLDGSVVFDSKGNYSGKKYPYAAELFSGGETATIGGTPCYIQTVRGQDADFIGVNIVPKSRMDDPRTPMLVYGAFTIMVFACASLYIVGGKLISRRIKEIEFAMKKVGSNNLSYRIPVRSPTDEFAEMALKFNKMCDELQKSIDRECSMEIQKRTAELGLLQVGINPHFLYNTLEVIRVRAIDSRDPDVAKMILNLANIYRAIVRGRIFIPIRNEIAICEMYMNIFSFRYGDSLEYEMEVDPHVMKYGIPKSLLQPMIENYFVHGIRPDDHTNYFSIHGFLKDGDIYFVLEDNGRGIAQDRLEKIQAGINQAGPANQTGYGLANIQGRIRLVYGQPYGICLESRENSYTRMTLRIRAMTCEELEDSLKDFHRTGR